MRVMREAASNGMLSYCSHGKFHPPLSLFLLAAHPSSLSSAYLTFVAKPLPPPVPSSWASLSHALGLTQPPKPIRFVVPELTPVSTLESKRFILAGRRRAHRIQGRDAQEALLKAFRTQLSGIENDRKKELAEKESEIGKEELIQSLQLELIVEG